MLGLASALRRSELAVLTVAEGVRLSLHGRRRSWLARRRVAARGATTAGPFSGGLAGFFRQFYFGEVGEHDVRSIGQHNGSHIPAPRPRSNGRAASVPGSR